MKYDVAVIGGGVAGYPAAIYLSMKGFKVVLFEERLIGGECTNYGCVPSKAWYYVSEAVKTLKKIGGEARIDWASTLSWVRDVVDNTRSSLEELLYKYGVEVVKGKARVKDREHLYVDGIVFEYGNLLLSLGTDPKPLGNIVFDHDKVLSNREVLYLDDKPESLLIIGGGVIGVEIANMFANLGVNVVIVEALDHILPFTDTDVALSIKKYLLEKNVTIYEKTLVKKIEKEESIVKAYLSNDEIIEADKILVAIGRSPKTMDVGLENIGVSLDKAGYIVVDKELRASGSNIYACGDAIGGPLLAHKALLESISVAKRIAGEESFTINYDLVPVTIFSGLEIALLGYSEKELRGKGLKYVVKKLPIYYLSAVRIKDSKYSFVKIMFDPENNRVYGVEIVSPNASEIVSAYLPLYMGSLTMETIAKTPYPHLTVSESLREFAEYVLGEPIHIFIKR